MTQTVPLTHHSSFIGLRTADWLSACFCASVGIDPPESLEPRARESDLMEFSATDLGRAVGDPSFVRDGRRNSQLGAVRQ